MPADDRTVIAATFHRSLLGAELHLQFEGEQVFVIERDSESNSTSSPVGFNSTVREREIKL